MTMHGHEVLQRVREALDTLPLPSPSEPITLRAAAPSPNRHGRIQIITTPSGPISVIRPVAEQLLLNRIISGTIDGHLHAADAATVKAALMASSGACDFCSAPGPSHVFDVPDFDMPGLPGNRSTGGWAACDVCADLVRANKRKALLDRSIAGLSFAKFSAAAISELQARFWRGMDDKADAAGTAAALADYVEDRLDVPGTDPQTDRSDRIAAVARVIGLDQRKVARLIKGEIDDEAIKKLAAWQKQFGPGRGPSISRRQLIEALGGQPHKPLQPIAPHWQVALDMRFAAMTRLCTSLADRSSMLLFSPKATDLHDPEAVRKLIAASKQASDELVRSYQADADALRHAETYSFNAETTAAITFAAASIPRETPLSAIETPGSGRTGWFWFAEPLAIATCATARTTAALLWYWSGREQPMLSFSAYGVGANDPIPLPSVHWHCGLTETVRDMIERCQQQDSVDRFQLVGPVEPFAHDATIRAITDLSLFFVAACVWMKQRIVVGETGHVERHAKKRYVREHKLAEPPSVQIIALRKFYREATGERPVAPGEESRRQYQHRWVVSGHPRLQACGPARADRKLIWIDPYTKGPADKPLLIRKRVYAVVR